MRTACPCGKTKSPDRTSCQDPITECIEPCSKYLPCGHACSRSCHLGPCPPCTAMVKTKCRCGAQRITTECSILSLASAAGGGAPLCNRKCNASMHCRRVRPTTHTLTHSTTAARFAAPWSTTSATGYVGGRSPARHTRAPTAAATRAPAIPASRASPFPICPAPAAAPSCPRPCPAASRRPYACTHAPGQSPVAIPRQPVRPLRARSHRRSPPLPPSVRAVSPVRGIYDPRVRYV